MSGLLVIMGSGETAPTMVKPHRELMRRRLRDRPAVLLDTPYGFQENADEISAKAVRYFAESVGEQVEVANWRSTPPPGLARERVLDRLREAGWMFAGPGSPTYALRQWAGTEIPDALLDVLSRDGVVVFASAAALTLGSHTVPVYEIYKAGITPGWIDGLDLVRRVTGLPAVVIPHFDNAEGGHHDTRYCYLGERRLSMLEQQLPDDTFVIGVDEHTGVVFDLGLRTATVLGNGMLTVRRGGESTRYRTGSVVDFADLASGAHGTAPPPPAATTDSSTVDIPAPEASLRHEASVLSARFDAALAERDVDGCVGCVLDLEQTLHDWSADTLSSDEGDIARAALRRMILRLGELAVAGARDPRDTIDPYVAALLHLRSEARQRRDYPTSDWIRDRLSAAGVEVRDTRDGQTWAFA